MYTRSYYTDDEKIRVPENYDGLAIEKEPTREEAEERVNDAPEPSNIKFKAPWEDIEKEDKTTEEAVSRAVHQGGIFDKIPTLFDGIFKKGLFDIKIGTEELLIIGIAAFLLFSKNGDRECSVLLLLLLFVK